ncbi:heteroproteinous nuclear ribonucleoprotein [Cichlidogyrus casuarinus]|uniref:Heteroproteinous nuclear ribonucleoprotein n=1 Tax=Cichlidogyrus casuarinus TaxID=1844966 RepID=A0ABD2PYL6_9PLAT
MQSYILRLRGLPYSAVPRDIVDFLKGVELLNDANGVHITQKPGGRPTGEAFVELKTEADLELAQTFHKKSMGHRYIEIFSATKPEMDEAITIGSSGPVDKSQMVLRLRGLPFETVKRDVYNFLSDVEPARGGVNLIMDHVGKCTGEAFVFFDNLEMLERAKAKHMEKIGHRWEPDSYSLFECLSLDFTFILFAISRYVEVFHSDADEFNRATRRQDEQNIQVTAEEVLTITMIAMPILRVADHTEVEDTVVATKDTIMGTDHQHHHEVRLLEDR